MKNLDSIKSLINKPLSEVNIKVDDVTYVKEGTMNILRITIDKDPYIDVDDCILATKIINPILDKEDIIEHTYMLDICSKEKGGNK